MEEGPGLIQKGSTRARPSSPRTGKPEARKGLLRQADRLRERHEHDDDRARDLWTLLSILGYGTIDEAVEIANDTEYGLAAYVSGSDLAKIRESRPAARRPGEPQRRADDLMAPFGAIRPPATAANGATMPLPNSWRRRQSSLTSQIAAE